MPSLYLELLEQIIILKNSDNTIAFEIRKLSQLLLLCSQKPTEDDFHSVNFAFMRLEEDYATHQDKLLQLLFYACYFRVITQAVKSANAQQQFGSAIYLMSNQKTCRNKIVSILYKMEAKCGADSCEISVALPILLRLSSLSWINTDSQQIIKPHYTRMLKSYLI